MPALVTLVVWLSVVCAVVLAGTATVLTFPLGIWITRPAGPRLKTSWFDKVRRSPPYVIVCLPITIFDAPGGTVTCMLAMTNSEALGDEDLKVGTANVLADLPFASATTTPEGVSLMTDPPTVTGGPFMKAVLVPTTMLDASGAAEMVLPPSVAIGIGGIVGLGMKVFDPVLPPIKTPDEATEMTTGWL